MAFDVRARLQSVKAAQGRALRRLRQPRAAKCATAAFAIVGMQSLLTSAPAVVTQPGRTDQLVSTDDLHFDISLTVAWMLIGAVSFMMALFYLVNSPDGEIRMYAWKVISSAINIFVAVLIFAASNRLLEYHVFWDIPPEIRHCHGFAIAVDFVHMLFWMTAMNIVLWYVARRVRLQYEAVEGEESAHRHELDVKSWAMLFAHVAGFAAINCFGDLQQVFFAGSPTQSMFVLPIAATCLGCCFWLGAETNHYLYMYNFSQLDKDYFDLWEEQTDEAENDIAALCLSFLICQSVRFHTGGRLPDPEGNEPPATRASWLLSISAAFAFAAVISVQLGDVSSRLLAIGLRRTFEIFQLVCCMCCAWCCYYGGKRLLIVLLPESAVVELVLRVVLAVVYSAVAFLIILALNLVVDRRKLAMAVRRKQQQLFRIRSGSKQGSLQDLSTKHQQRRSRWWRFNTGDLQHQLVLHGSGTLIKATAILIGFSWEEAFESSVTKTCERTPVGHPVWSELILKVLLALMVLPAWRMYILPQAHESASSGSDLLPLKKLCDIGARRAQS